MSADQAKLVYQLILVTIAFLHPINERQEKTYTCYLIGRAVSEVVKGWPTKRS